MISGYDSVYKKHSPYQGECLDFAIRQIKQQWPLLVICDAHSRTPFISSREISYPQTNEVFVFKTYHSYEQWLARGACEATFNTMFHLVEDDESITIVMDDPEDTVSDILRQSLDQFTKENRLRYGTR